MQEWTKGTGPYIPQHPPFVTKLANGVGYSEKFVNHLSGEDQKNTLRGDTFLAGQKGVLLMEQKPIFVTFAGGDIGSWRVVRIETMIGLPVTTSVPDRCHRG